MFSFGDKRKRHFESGVFARALNILRTTLMRLLPKAELLNESLFFGLDDARTKIAD
jgi:hypothetical protein